MSEPRTICAAECTSGCHADDCEHHGHLPETPSRDEMLLGADPSEEWVADAWAERDDRLGGAS